MLILYNIIIFLLDFILGINNLNIRAQKFFKLSNHICALVSFLIHKLRRVQIHKPLQTKTLNVFQKCNTRWNLA